MAYRAVFATRRNQTGERRAPVAEEDEEGERGEIRRNRLGEIESIGRGSGKSHQVRWRTCFSTLVLRPITSERGVESTR